MFYQPKNLLRKTTGVSNADLQNKRYNELKKHIVTLAQQTEKAIFVSGHEHSLQYIVEDNVPQIVSGSGSKESSTKLGGGALFTYGKQGFAKLTVYKDQSSYVEFIDAKTNKVVFEQPVLNADNIQTLIAYPDHFPATTTASVYDKEKVKKSGLYKFLWGDRYRKYFGTDVTVPTVNLDTIFGGLTPVRKGGGHQSKSLRMISKDGKEYVMRAIKKNAVQYLQTVLFKDQYIQGQFENTATEDLLMDVFAGAHPFAPFVVGELSDAVDIFHTNPTLYYIPKQKALGKFNREFGDELYMIEERTTDGHGDQKSFGYSNKLISTDDMIKNTTSDDDYKVDEASYLRARLFDMLIGDWDRHDDQWRWATFKEGKKTTYKPIPRDRDQAFSIMGDGFLLGFASRASTDVALFQSFDEDLRNPGGFNLEPYPLDVNILAESTKEDWDKQVKILQEGITDEVIDRAFALMPKEVQDKTVDKIKSTLKARRGNLQKIADKYFAHVIKYQVVKGSDKDNLFEIDRLPNGQTKVSVFNLKKGKKGSQFHEKTYHKKETKEIWIYGLDDDDIFIVKGNGDTSIKLRLIGGQNKDTYTIENGSNVVMYDYKSKKNIFTTNKGKKKLQDSYTSNVFDFKKPKNTSKGMFPAFSSNPDDGTAIGVSQVTTKFGFERNPFSYKHTINANYFTATSGFNVSYVGEFANVFGDWNLGFEAFYSNPNYAINFFGFGNETYNPEDDFSNDDDGLDFNRVRLQQLRFAPSIIKKGDLGSTLSITASFEAIEVENTKGRYINKDPNIPNSVFNSQSFVGAELSYNFLNTDNAAFTTLGMETNLVAGYKSNIDESTGYGYLMPSISFNHKLINSGDIVFATKFAGQVNFGDDYEFYQAANIGANNGLRSYRNQRFTGKSAYYQSSDIRFLLKRTNTSVVPIYMGIYTGFDYGKVWHPNATTGDWNTSYGGGIFVTAANFITGNLSAFNGDDGVRIAFRIGFGF